MGTDMFKVGDVVVRLKGDHWEIWSRRCREHRVDPTYPFRVEETSCSGSNLRVLGMPEYWRSANFTLLAAIEEDSLDKFM